MKHFKGRTHRRILSAIIAPALMLSFSGHSAGEALRSRPVIPDPSVEAWFRESASSNAHLGCVLAWQKAKANDLRHTGYHTFDFGSVATFGLKEPGSDSQFQSIAFLQNPDDRSHVFIMNQNGSLTWESAFRHLPESGNVNDTESDQKGQRVFWNSIQSRGDADRDEIMGTSWKRGEPPKEHTDANDDMGFRREGPRKTAPPSDETRELHAEMVGCLSGL
ncbi:MAG: hypothetical protein HY059_09435 [Proteobacteria bacterium]|nr:hypothetical protein [Pseudomonadota bacterium]